MPPLRNALRWTLLATILSLAACTAGLPASVREDLAAREGRSVAATVNGHPILLAESELGLLDAYVAAELLRQEAERRDLPSVTDLVDAELGRTLRSPTLRELRDQFRDHRALYAGRSFKAARKDVERDWLAARRGEARDALVARLAERGDVVVYDRRPAHAAAQTAVAQPAPAPPVPAAGGPREDAPPRLGAPTLGPGSAPITLVVFGDYTCRFCKRAAETVSRLVRVWPADLRVVYRYYPRDGVTGAVEAAHASACAEEQDLFWPMHDHLYAHSGDLAIEDVRALARKLRGLDRKRFDDCLDTRRMAWRVETDIEAGAAAGVRALPTFFLNGRIIEGAASPARFRDEIEAALETLAPLSDSRR